MMVVSTCEVSIVAKVQVITSDNDKAARISTLLEKHKHHVQSGAMKESLRKEMLAAPPDAVVIDLERAPATGRDLGLYLRVQASTRQTILVYLDGNADKVDAIRELLPDAIYTQFESLAEDLSTSLASPPQEPHVPESVFAGYAGRPLPAKLGIKAGMVVGMIDPPKSISNKLKPLPEGVVLHEDIDTPPDIALWFVERETELLMRLREVMAHVKDGKLWILWPKASSGMGSDLTQKVVRKHGLDAGWVDFKVCAFDETWSGLCFTTRR